MTIFISPSSSALSKICIDAERGWNSYDKLSDYGYDKPVLEVEDLIKLSKR